MPPVCNLCEMNRLTNLRRSDGTLLDRRHGIYRLCDGSSWHCITKWETLSWSCHTLYCIKCECHTYTTLCHTSYCIKYDIIHVQHHVMHHNIVQHIIVRHLQFQHEFEMCPVSCHTFLTSVIHVQYTVTRVIHVQHTVTRVIHVQHTVTCVIHDQQSMDCVILSWPD